MRAREALCAAAGFLLAAVAWTWPLAIEMAQGLPFDGGERFQARAPMHDCVWDLWWAGRALESGSDPFHCELVLWPEGVDLALSDHVFLWGLLSLPLQAVGGLPAALGAVLLLLFAISALAAYALARTLALGRMPAALAAFAWAFSPGLLAQGQVHLEFTASPWPPLFALALSSWMRSGERGHGGERLLSALLCGAALGLSLWTSWPASVALAGMGLVLAFCAPWSRDPLVRSGLRRPLSWAAALFAAGALALPCLRSLVRASEGAPLVAVGPGGPAAPGLAPAALALAGAAVLLAPRSRWLVAAGAVLLWIARDPGGLLGAFDEPPGTGRLVPDGRAWSAVASLPLALAAGHAVEALWHERWGRPLALASALLLALSSWNVPWPMVPWRPPAAVRAIAGLPGEGAVLVLPPAAGPAASQAWQTVHGRPTSLFRLDRVDARQWSRWQLRAPDLFAALTGAREPPAEWISQDLEQLGVEHVLLNPGELENADRLAALFDRMERWDRASDGDGILWWYRASLLYR